MKALYVTDLHGVEWKYDRLLKIAKDLQVKVVINGGDMLTNNNEQGEFINGYLNKHFSEFKAAKIYYLCMLGNDDLRIFDDLFERLCMRYPFIVNLAQRKYKIENFEFIGFNLVVDYPFRLKDRCRMDTADYVFQPQHGTGVLSVPPNGWQELDDWPSYARTFPTIEEELNRLVLPENMENAIYVIHMPPYGIGLDKIYRGSEHGSKAVYNFLKQHQPRMALHGHIHEAPDVTGAWYSTIGKTVCIQPGQLTEFGQSNELTYVVIDLSTMKYERKKLRK